MPAFKYFIQQKIFTTEKENVFQFVWTAQLDYSDTINNPNKYNLALVIIDFDAIDGKYLIKRIDIQTDDLIRYVFKIPNNTYICHNSTQKFVVLDSNFNRIRIIENAPSNVSSIIPKNSLNWVCSANEDIIYTTTDAGATWEQFQLRNGETSLIEASNLQKVCHIKNNEYILLGSNRITLFEVGFTNTSVPEEKGSADKKCIVFPNPSASEIRLSVAGRVEILDLNGISLMKYDFLHSDSNINILPLIAGTYIIKVTNETGEHTEKFVVTR